MDNKSLSNIKLQNHLSWRLANLSEIPFLNQLINLSYRGDLAKLGWTTEADILDGQRTDEDSLVKILNEKNSSLFILENKSNFLHISLPIVGCIYLKQEEDHCYLGMLTVHPQLQNLGLGKWFLKQAEKQAQDWRCKRIYMTVISIRHSLIDWYQRHGYCKTTQTRPFPYGDTRFGQPKLNDLQFIILEKKI